MNGSLSKIATALAASVSITLYLARDARAEPPNDNIADAITIPALPFSYEQDTTGAAEGTAPCTFGPTVWFQFTSPTDTYVSVDVGAAGEYFVSVFQTSDVEDINNNIVCLNAFDGFWFAQANVPYFISASSVFGNDLVLSATAYGISIDPAGTFDPHTGNATSKTTMTCGETSTFFIAGPGGTLPPSGTTVTQKVGRLVIEGTSNNGAPAFGTCGPGQPFSFSTIVGPPDSNGVYRGGNAEVSVTANFQIGVSPFGTMSTSATVKLKPH
ncbi:hypothetical protein WME90_35085 [Sorangium sp. So ce375]|uniref:hypothetical protein n=1 Tax=Sorangium sp. So ce375 TaxID=3133306 RepID=UPI003F5B7B78